VEGIKGIGLCGTGWQELSALLHNYGDIALQLSHRTIIKYTKFGNEYYAPGQGIWGGKAPRSGKLSAA